MAVFVTYVEVIARMGVEDALDPAGVENRADFRSPLRVLLLQEVVLLQDGLKRGRKFWDASRY